MKILLPIADSQRTASITLVADNTNGEENDSDEGSPSATSDDGEEAEEGLIQITKTPSNVAYEEFQGCLSDVEGEEFPTEQEVQDCIESSYSGIDSNENTPTESTDEDEDGVNEGGSTERRRR